MDIDENRLILGSGLWIQMRIDNSWEWMDIENRLILGSGLDGYR